MVRAQRLLDDVEHQFARRPLGDGEAHAVDGDALAEADVRPVGGEDEPDELRPGGDADHPGGLLDDPGEHGYRW